MERRRWVRFIIAAASNSPLCRVLFDTGAEIEAELVDISREGMQLRNLSRFTAIEPGGPVRVRALAGCEACGFLRGRPGTVRWRDQAGVAFGVQLDQALTLRQFSGLTAALPVDKTLAEAGFDYLPGSREERAG
jgi:hypothetical protein